MVKCPAENSKMFILLSLKSTKNSTFLHLTGWKLRSLYLSVCCLGVARPPLTDAAELIKQSHLLQLLKSDWLAQVYDSDDRFKLHIHMKRFLQRDIYFKMFTGFVYCTVFCITTCGLKVVQRRKAMTNSVLKPEDFWQPAERLKH